MKKSYKKTFWILLILLVLTRYFTVKPRYVEGDLIRITSKVMSEPIRYEMAQRVVVGGLKAYLPLYPEISYGDEVIIEGRVEEGSIMDAELVSLKESKSLIYGLRNNLLTKLKPPEATFIIPISPLSL